MDQIAAIFCDSSLQIQFFRHVNILVQLIASDLIIFIDYQIWRHLLKMPDHEVCNFLKAELIGQLEMQR